MQQITANAGIAIIYISSYSLCIKDSGLCPIGFYFAPLEN